ncbi:AAA family ATPase [Rhizobiaceae bacterium n13]|uniref:AAA family ATPase n=1 Tax=Ferirhizobium litorale TaxID=2927786 RepID=A0AAE3QD86_9HYPH|nr:AAA family ATPase [Fererhizobium litorale]MDI7863246.1 AAA family ATPase [Fererhizobium litorale]MDI7923020.1 AAA family ATPase [Fererhizobium litorale]
MIGEVGELPKAVDALRQANRIVVIGCSGGGKTTLSLRIAGALQLPFISMDREFFWLPGWQNRTKPDERARIAVAAAGDRWVMDGTGSSSFDLRLPRAQFVLWVRMPRHLCLWGVVKRWLRWRGRSRPHMADDCPERLDPEFLRYIWTFERKVSPAIATALARYGADVPVYEVKSRAEMRALLDLVDVSA